MYYVVKYCGPFGFIKPWTAVRDDETFSQQFLTPSIIEGIKQKLQVSKILRHRLSYMGMSVQQEQTQPKAFTYQKKNKTAHREKSILKRGVLLNPKLYLAFETKADAELAASQHICLCRNEDVLFPDENIIECGADEFDKLAGFELIFENTTESFMVGFNRFELNDDNQPKPMYGKIKIEGNPAQAYGEE